MGRKKGKERNGQPPQQRDRGSKRVDPNLRPWWVQREDSTEEEEPWCICCHQFGHEEESCPEVDRDTDKERYAPEVLLCSAPKWMENEHPQPKRGHWDSFFDLVGTMSWCPSCGEGGHSVINCPRPGEEEEGRPEGSWEAYLNALEAQNLCPACAEWGHFVVSCPALQEEEERAHQFPASQGDCILLPPPPPKADDVQLLLLSPGEDCLLSRSSPPGEDHLLFQLPPQLLFASPPPEGSHRLISIPTEEDSPWCETGWPGDDEGNGRWDSSPPYKRDNWLDLSPTEGDCLLSPISLSGEEEMVCNDPDPVHSDRKTLADAGLVIADIPVAASISAGAARRLVTCKGKRARPIYNSAPSDCNDAL
ncbi:UNVERIFIED_CONTAM: hypothetical protein FKN15_029681 [Acipenser sinensis]